MDHLDKMGKGKGALVDVRSPKEYSGELLRRRRTCRRKARSGAVTSPARRTSPGARPCNEDGTFKSADELRELYGGKGVTPDKDVIAYCRIGERSAHTWFVLKYLLGYPNVRNYDGSWTEWGSLVGAPIER